MMDFWSEMHTKTQIRLQTKRRISSNLPLQIFPITRFLTAGIVRPEGLYTQNTP